MLQRLNVLEGWGRGEWSTRAKFRNMDIQTISPGELLFSQVCGEFSVSARAASGDEYGVWAEVEISQADQICWSSPKTHQPEDALAFGVWFDGPALPQWFGQDVEARLVLLAPRPKSDISPPVFRYLLFETGTLECLAEGAYLAEEQSMVFSFVPGSDLESLDKAVRWIERVEGDKVTVTVLEPNSPPRLETASLKTVSFNAIELRA